MTHKFITSKFLRRAMARELWEARRVRAMSADFFAGVRLGIESAFWAMQMEFDNPRCVSIGNVELDAEDIKNILTGNLVVKSIQSPACQSQNITE